MCSLSENSISLLPEELAHLFISLIFDLVFQCFDCRPYIHVTLALDPLYKHLRAHIVEPLCELSLDLFAQKLHVLYKSVLSVALRESLVALILLEIVSHVLPLREGSDKLAGFIQKISESFQTGSEQRLRVLLK